MRFRTCYIAKEIYDVLEVNVYDSEDIREINEHFYAVKNIMIEQSAMRYLRLFQQVEVLVLTGGIPEKEDLQALYDCSSIKILVLDYEETDTDEEGIVLSRFPNLKYVLSQSNLNIHNLAAMTDSNIKIDIVNVYTDGRNVKRALIRDGGLLAVPHALFFSVEAQSPASVSIMKILKPIEDALNPIMLSGKYSSKLDEVCIIPICLSNKMLENGFGKERKYISFKQRRADIRLQINYESFLSANDREQINLCLECIVKSIEIIQKKDPSFKVELFIGDLSKVIDRGLT